MAFDVRDPSRPRRRSIRLETHDYARSATYFVTLCVWQRECVFGKIVAGEMQESEAGEIVAQAWMALTQQFQQVSLHDFVVMPNHFHGILVIQQAATETSPSSLGQVLRAYKSRTGIAVNRLLERSEHPLWQRNYYERSLRDAHEIENARGYIARNPARWHWDAENPANAPTTSPRAAI